MFQEQKFNADGVEINFIQASATGQPLVLLHGTASEWQSFSPLIPVFAEKFKVLHPEYDIKYLVLGHLLRGGNPTANDRILASRLGIAAVNALIDGQHNCMIGWVKNQIAYTPFPKAVKHHIQINQQLNEILQLLSY